MWGKIKKFFKWIADHTGISWVARKISSGWKWLFGGKANATQQNTSQQEKSSVSKEQEPDQSKDYTTPKTLDNEVNSDQSIPPVAPDKPQEPVISTSETDAKELPENFPTPNPKNADSDVLKEASNENYLKVGDKGLLLVLTSEQFVKCKDYKDSQSTSPGELLMYIKCGENEYRITGTNNDNLPNTICIKSVLKKSKDGKYVNGNIVLVEEEIKHVKKMLELNNDGVVKVDSISNRAFEAPTLEQPKPNTTTTQQTVNNNSNGEATAEIKQAPSSTTAGLTEQLPEVNSTQELSTPNNEPVKIDTPDQPKSPAVPNEPQETLVNAHEEKGKPNDAASNEEVQPEVSNEEVTIESGEFFDAEEEVTTEPEEFFDAEEEVTTEPEEFFDAQDDEVKQPKSLTIDMVVEQADTPHQLIPSAVPNKSQGNSIVINGIVIPEGAKLKFFPEISDFLSRASLEREISFCKVAPNSLLSQTREEQTATINVFNGNLELRLADDIQQKLEDYKHPKNNGKYRMEIHCKEDKFNIHFFKMDNADGSLIINMLQKIGDKQLLSDTSKIKKSLGLKKQLTSVAIDFICKYQSVESLKLKVPTNNGVPSSEITSPEAEQHTVDTNLSVNA